jgi:hypothetical protein
MNSKQDRMLSCSMCTFIDSKTADNANIVHRTERFVVGINPRWSPHLGRVAIAPTRHVGASGVYGLESLSENSRRELVHLRRRVTNAIIDAFSSFGMSVREGCAHIDAIVRPSHHPSLDLFPSYDNPPVFNGWTFPSYERVALSIGSGPETLAQASNVLASFSNTALTMPLELRCKITEELRRHLHN